MRARSVLVLAVLVAFGVLGTGCAVLEDVFLSPPQDDTELTAVQIAMECLGCFPDNPGLGVAPLTVVFWPRVAPEDAPIAPCFWSVATSQNVLEKRAGCGAWSYRFEQPGEYWVSLEWGKGYSTAMILVLAPRGDDKAWVDVTAESKLITCTQQVPVLVELGKRALIRLSCRSKRALEYIAYRVDFRECLWSDDYGERQVLQVPPERVWHTEIVVVGMREGRCLVQGQVWTGSGREGETLTLRNMVEVLFRMP